MQWGVRVECVHCVSPWRVLFRRSIDASFTHETPGTAESDSRLLLALAPSSLRV